MNTVNLFFACDDGYVPFLSVALTSIRSHRDPARHYAIRVLHTGLSEAAQEKLRSLQEDKGFTLEFPDISRHVAAFAQKLHTRDYYSSSTYYRLFIPVLYPQLNKALYLDSDLVLCRDVAQLYDVELGDDLVGAVPDGVVGTVEEFKLYVQNRLNIENAEHYFNAGVLLMNLDAMRRCDFSRRFLELLQAVTFRVGQDQDYLNVLCSGRVRYLGFEWNTMPTGIVEGAPGLIHYNMDAKPWQRDDVKYADRFWDVAALSGFLPQIKAIRKEYTPARRKKAVQQTMDLIGLGYRQAMDHQENARIHRKIRQVVCAL